MNERVYLYPVWVRLWHLFNALLFLVLIFSGLSLQYSGVPATLIPFKYAVSIHSISGILLSVNYIFYLFGNYFTSNGKYYKCPLPGMFNRIAKQFRYYSYGIFKKEAPPFPVTADRKFNPLQKLCYVIVMYFFMPLLIISGIVLLFPDYIPTQIFSQSGIHLTDLIHITLGFILSMFMIVHIYLCTIGKTPLSNFKSMISGWH